MDFPVNKRRQLLAAALLLPLLTLLTATAVKGAVLYYDWEVDYAFWSPDCVERLIIAVNGVYPGPTIRATAGDTITVKLTNNMPTEGIVIHWHGMHQRQTPWGDGTAYVSQCPINPGEVFYYNFTADHSGTFFWHGHYGMQRAAGFYGSLIIDPAPGEKVPIAYDGELSIVLNDWWHRSMYEQELGLFSNPFRWVGEPQSLLIEGRGAYNCSLVPPAVANSGDALTCNASRPQCSPYILPVVPGKTYRLRIASVASLNALNFILEGHNFTVVEADGYYVQPVVMSNLDVYSGESYSILFTANQNASKNYWAASNVRGRRPMTPTGLAVLNYLPNPPTLLPTTPAPVSPLWNDTAYSVAKARMYVARNGFRVPLPNRPTSRTLKLLNTQNRFNGFTKWALNNVTFVPPATPVLAEVKFNIQDPNPATYPHFIPPDVYSPSTYDIYSVPPNPNTTAGSSFYEFQNNDIVDVILQNANTLTVNNSEVHPWHLHGHDFWILGYGDGVFNSSSSYSTLNYWNPPYRNTAPLFPYGWTFIRYVADNPGVWPFHCHIESHFHMGMGVVFTEGRKQLATIPVPEQTLGCGLSKGIQTKP